VQARSARALTEYRTFQVRKTAHFLNTGFTQGDKTPGALARQWTGGNRNNQWILTPEGNGGYVEIRNRWSGLCLDADHFNNGSYVRQQPCDHTRSQGWFGDSADGQFIKWKNEWAAYKGFNRVLTVQNVANAGSPMVVWDYYGGHDQQFMPASRFE
jgi:hypothetical protein